MSINYNRNIKRAALIQETADLTGVSVRSVRRVLENERKNETVVTVYMTLLEGTNNLIKEVAALVPLLDSPVRRKDSNSSISTISAK